MKYFKKKFRQFKHVFLNKIYIIQNNFEHNYLTINYFQVPNEHNYLTINYFQVPNEHNYLIIFLEK
jgi:hypothetical protein